LTDSVNRSSLQIKSTDSECRSSSIFGHDGNGQYKVRTGRLERFDAIEQQRHDRDGREIFEILRKETHERKNREKRVRQHRLDRRRFKLSTNETNHVVGHRLYGSYRLRNRSFYLRFFSEAEIYEGCPRFVFTEHQRGFEGGSVFEQSRRGCVKRSAVSRGVQLRR
jgi:hypothetical protein